MEYSIGWWVKSSKKVDQEWLSGYTDAQVEAARVWAYVIKNVPSELNISNSAAGTKIYNGGLGVRLSKDVPSVWFLFSRRKYHLCIQRWWDSDDLSCTEPLATVCGWELNSEEFMTQFTQGILDHAETVTLPDGDPDMIRQILAVLK